MDKRIAEEFQRAPMAEKLSSRSRETPRNVAVRDNKRAGIKARLVKDGRLW